MGKAKRRQSDSIRKLRDQHTIEAAQKLFDIMNDETDSRQVEAASALLDIGYGECTSAADDE